MAKFIYLTDTHYGGSPVLFHEQPSYPQRLPQLLALLDGRIRQDPDIQLVIHGGDMVNQCTPDALQGLEQVFRLSVPLYLCLGNHDLTHPAALSRWMHGAPHFFPTGSPVFSLPLGDAFLHILPNQWCETPYYWESVQDAHFLPNSLAAVEALIRQHPSAAHLLITHSNVLGIQPEQSGMDQAYNAPRESFTREVFDLLKRHPQLRHVISGHTHANTHVIRGGAHYITASSLVETPFEYKLMDVQDGRITMTTESLAGEVNFQADYDSERNFIQGRAADREL